MMPGRRGSSRRRTVILAATALVAGLWLLRPSRKAVTPVSRASSLTGYSGSEAYPSFSPNGAEIVFSWVRSTPSDCFHLFVKKSAANAPEQLTRGPDKDVFPVWSPDGHEIAFARIAGKNATYYLLSPVGGPESKLADAGTVDDSEPLLSWSSNGKYVYAVLKQTGQPASVFLVPVAGGEQRRMTVPPENSLGDYSPAVSPDGRMLAFVRRSNDQEEDIYIAPLAGGEARRLTWDNRPIRGLVWTPDGKEIIFSSNRMDMFRLWRVSVSGGSPHSVGGAADEGQFPALSRDGSRLAFSRSASDTKIWRYTLPVSKTDSPSPPERVITETRLDSQPRFSPDGKHIVFISNRSGSREIWICDAAGRNPKQLTHFNGARLENPRWSPDGRQILLQVWNGERPGIDVVDMKGGSRRLLVGQFTRFPTWSRDGKRFYFESRRQIWQAPVPGGAAEQVTKRGGSAAVESADGDSLFYYNRRAIWRMPLRDGKPANEVSNVEEPVSEDVHPASPASWALARNGIYYVEMSRNGRRADIRFFRFDKRDVLPVGTLELTRRSAAPGLSLAPDGKSLLCTEPDDSGTDLLLVENFR